MLVGYTVCNVIGDSYYSTLIGGFCAARVSLRLPACAPARVSLRLPDSQSRNLESVPSRVVTPEFGVVTYAKSRMIRLNIILIIIIIILAPRNTPIIMLIIIICICLCLGLS